MSNSPKVVPISSHACDGNTEPLLVRDLRGFSVRGLCHPDAPVWAVLENDRCHLRVECTRCSALIAVFEVRL